MKVVSCFIVFALVVIAAGLIIMYTGGYNVAASSPHSAIGHWIFDTTMVRSVEARGGGIKPPVSLTDPERVHDGLKHYHEMCVGCHGAPGKQPAEMAKGLLPEPPDLAKVVKEWTPGELFWIVKNGVKMTGMPAWGKTHRDDELWAIVAFLKQLPETTPESYKAMVQSLKTEDAGEEHQH